MLCQKSGAKVVIFFLPHNIFSEFFIIKCVIEIFLG